MDKLKADLAYFKDDFWNNEIFKVIHRPTNSIPHPDMGHGASTPNSLDASVGGPGSTTPRGNPLPWATPTPSPRISLVQPWGTLLYPHLDQCHCLEEQHLNTNPNLSINLSNNLSINLNLNTNLSINLNTNLSINTNLSTSLSLSHNLGPPQCQMHMESKPGKATCRICPWMVVMESNLNLDTQQTWEMRHPTTQVHPLCASDVEGTITQNSTARNEEFIARTVRASNMHRAVVHLYPEPLQPQMVKPGTLPAHQAQTGEASKPIHQICPKTRERRSHRTKTSRRIGIHNSLRPKRQALAHKQYHPGWTEIHNHHLLVTISISTHPHQVDTCIHPHHSSIYPNLVRSLYDKILTLLLHFSRWPNSINNILRPVRTRQNPLRTSPAPHPSPPL